MFTEYDDLAPTETSRVLLLLAPGRNRELLAEYLGGEDRYAVTTDPDAVDPGEVDLCLVDDAALERHVERVRRCKHVQHPVHVPCLCIDRSDDGRGGGAGATETVVDEVIRAPLRKAELSRRLASLLQARSLSLQLSDSKRQYEQLVRLLPAGVLLVHDGVVEYANRAAEEMLAAGGTVGSDFAEFVAPDDRERVAEFVAAAPAEASDDVLLAELRDRGGDAITAELAAAEVQFRGQPVTQLLVRDVTEREQREERLRLYGRAMDEAKVGITITDPSVPDNPLVYVNERFLQLTGYSESEVLGRNCRFLQCADTDPETVSRIREAIDAEQPLSVEILNERADGTRFMNQLDVSPVYDESGEVSHFIGFQRDVSDRHRRHAEVVETRNQLQSTLQRISDAFMSFDREWRFTYVNERAEELLERDAADLVGENVWEAFPEAVDLSFYDQYQRAMASGETVHFEEYYPPLERWFQVNAYADESGLSVYFRDVTDRKERERELERFETVVTTAGDPIFTMDADDRFTSVNAAMVDLTGYDRERLLGAPLTLVCPERDARAYANVAERLDPADPDDASVELTVHGADGTDHLCEASVARVPADEEGGGPETVGVLHDLTELHRREQHLAVLDRVLRHNLRNKMNVVLGRAEVLADDPDGVSDHAEAISDTARDLLSMSETARAFQNAVTEGVEPYPRDVVEPIRTMLTDRDGARFVDDLPDSLWAMAHDSVDMAFSELLDNAVEHGTDAHSDTVRVTADRETVDGEEWVTVTILDRGPGIPAGEGIALTRETETALEHGTGLGLWVARWTVERSGGEVVAEENDPRGTVVRVRLRAADPPAA